MTNLKNGIQDHLFSYYPNSPYLVLWRFFELSALTELLSSIKFVNKTGCDYGCGAGQIAAVCNLSLCCGLEIDYGLCRDAKFRNTYQFIINSDLQSIPCKTSGFDYGLCNCVLEHIPDGELALKEIALTLKPGALLFITLPSTLFCELGWLQKKRPELDKSLQHFNYFDEDKLRSWANKAGLELISIQEYMPEELMQTWVRWRSWEIGWGRNFHRVWVLFTNYVLNKRLKKLLTKQLRGKGAGLAAVLKRIN